MIPKEVNDNNFMIPDAVLGLGSDMSTRGPYFINSFYPLSPIMDGVDPYQGGPFNFWHAVSTLITGGYTRYGGII